MKPQTQEFPQHDPENGVFGDCLRAALASILELGLRQVPHFVKKHWDDDEACEQAVNQFLSKRGFLKLHLPYEPYLEFLEGQAQITGADCYHLMFGFDYDGNPHACVGLNGQMIHDPHPMRRGFANPPSEWEIGLMVSRMSDAPKGKPVKAAPSAAPAPAPATTSPDRW
jgi:hypothetical protein